MSTTTWNQNLDTPQETSQNPQNDEMNLDPAGKVVELLESGKDGERLTYPELNYEDFRSWVTGEFRQEFEDNSDPTGMGIESENPLVREEDGVMPTSPEYQFILNEEHWQYIEDELQDVEGYGEDFWFELKEIEEDGHFEERPVAMKFELKGDSDVISPIEIDWDLGPQEEIDSGAYPVSFDGDGEFGLLLDVLMGIKEGSRKYIAENFEQFEFEDQGLTKQIRESGEAPDEVDGIEVVDRETFEDYDREDIEDFVQRFSDYFSSVKYYTDYFWTFGPAVFQNMFGGSTQLTSGLYTDEEEDLDLDNRISEEMAYRMVFEEAFDVLTSNTYIEDEDGEKKAVGAHQVYWESQTYAEHFLDEADVNEDGIDRVGAPWKLIERLMDEDEDMDEFERLVDYYMNEHHLGWIIPPEEEYIEFEGDVDYDEVKLLGPDPEDPKTPREYLEDGKMKVSKVVAEDSGDLEQVTGYIDLSGMDQQELRDYHRSNFRTAHIGAIHHGVRPKFDKGGFEYRVSRQNGEKEPAVAIAKAATIPHGDKIKEAMDDRGYDPSNPQTVPDFDNEEAWRDVFSDVYDEDVIETGRTIAPNYSEEFETYVEKSLDQGPPGKRRLEESKAATD